MRAAHTAAWVLLITSALRARPVDAATVCPAPPHFDAALEAQDGSRRLAWIRLHLAATAHRARVWTWGWGTAIGVATLGNLAPLPFVKPEDRIDWYTGAATTIVGIVPLIVAPLAVISDSDTLQARMATAGSDPSAVCALLSDAEGRLARDAQNQADGQRWWLHVGNVVLNTGVGLFLGLGYQHWKAGAFNAISGSLIGEAIILTQPAGSIDDLRRYRAGRLEDDPPAQPTATLDSRPLGVSYAWVF